MSLILESKAKWNGALSGNKVSLRYTLDSNFSRLA